MSGGIKEDDLLSFALYDRGPDVLGDSPGFLVRDGCLANVVQKRGLAMVYMSHDRDDRGPVNHAAFQGGLLFADGWDLL